MRRRFISLNDVVYYDYNDYMTIEALEDGVIIKTPRDVEYGINGAGWKKLKKDYSLSLTKGQFISFKCYLSSGSFGTIKITGGKCYLRGNCLSLIHGDGKDLSIHNYAFDNLFENNTSIIGFEASFLRATTLSKHCYSCMFKGCTSLTTAPELPATTLAEFCYYYMFSGCKSLTTAPNILPATSLARDCYEYMFYGCSSLTTAPKLPATTLGDNCYYSMFRDCTSLTTAPELPATTLKTRCYYYMFNGCKKINYIKMLATDISANYCLYNWVSRVSSTGTFVKNPAMNSLTTGTSGIPSSWRVLNSVTTPENQLKSFTIRETSTNTVWGPYKFEEGMTIDDFYESECNLDWDIIATTGAYGVSFNGGNYDIFSWDEILQEQEYTFNYKTTGGEPM